ncbi:MAG: hypothetical protein AAGI08_11950 [Bacteroidota bacterium]
MLLHRLTRMLFLICAGFAGVLGQPGQARAQSTDTPQPDSPADVRELDRDGVFEPGTISKAGRYEFCAALSEDGREFFVSIQHDGYVEILTSRHEDGAWTDPVHVIGTPDFSAQDPMLSLDGRRLYFISKPEGHGDIWFIEREEEGWSAPVRLPAPINTEHNEYYISFAETGELAFASDRAAEQLGDYDVYLTTAAGNTFTEPVPLPRPVNTRLYEADPFLSPDGTYLLFASNRRGGPEGSLGLRDLYVSFRDGEGQWTEPKNLGPEVNSAGLELCPYANVTLGRLFYTSRKNIHSVDLDLVTKHRPR